MATLTAIPSNKLKIRLQKVNTAFLAKKEIESIDKTGETHIYTFKGDNNTSTIKKKNNIAKIIYKNIKKDLKKENKTTSVDQIVSQLTKKSYKKDDCIDIPLVKDKIKFTKLVEASLGDEVYVVIQTENMRGKRIKLNLKQAEEDCLQAKDHPIILQQKGEKSILLETWVGKFAGYNKDTVINAKDFEDYAISKITLLPKDEDTQRKYNKALNKTDDKKTNLFMVIDAEPKNATYREVYYDEKYDLTPNLWYYGKGKWFELKGGSIEIKYLFSSKEADVSEKSKKILNEIGIKSKNNTIPITSTVRSPKKQAQIMYSQTVSNGVTAQKALYGSNGDKIIDVYVTQKAKKKTKSEIISKMEEKIIEIGPSKVSKHCGDSDKINVIDISSRRLKNPKDFLAELRKYEKNGKIKKVINETDRNCYHIEITQ